MRNLFTILLAICTLSAFAQKNSPEGEETKVDYKYSISLPYIVPDELISGVITNEQVFKW